VLEAKAPEEALVMCEEHGSRVDLLLCDVDLPQMTGPTLAAQLAAKHPGMRALFMSGYSDADTGPDVAYIQKPFSPYSLAEQLRKFLAEV
jgi:two-component system cell cycle sensor histidine kinase/response regulator CckA